MPTQIETDTDAPEAFDTLSFRRTLGMFATGVTVVTARTHTGEPIGLTVNSFNSVSLAPPLIVWSLSRTLPLAEGFEQCSHFAINVLAANQVTLSRHFASRLTDKFAEMDFEEGLGGAPLLPECCAWFECRNAIRHDGGDHVLFLGEVERFSQGEGDPLVYFGGRYRWLDAD